MTLGGTSLLLCRAAMRRTLRRRGLCCEGGTTPFGLVRHCNTSSSMGRGVRGLSVRIGGRRSNLCIYTDLTLGMPLASRRLRTVRGFLDVRCRVKVFSAPHLHDRSMRRKRNILSFSMSAGRGFSRGRIRYRVRGGCRVASLTRPRFP